MTVVDGPGDSDLFCLLTTIQELSEQLTQNRALAISLHTSAGAVKTHAAHAQTGFVLRRFNLDKPKEAYDAELARMNASIATENQGLQHDNKQLGILIREYEQTLETVMSAFRTRARDVQEHELALVRDYESKLLAKESEHLLRALTASTAESASLGRISRALRRLMRVLNGEDTPSAGDGSPGTAEGEGEGGGHVDELGSDGAGEDGALEKEIELARLQLENAVLKRMLGLPVAEAEDGGDAERGVGMAEQQLLPVPQPPPGGQPKRMLGGASGTVGPYGTYKRRQG